MLEIIFVSSLIVLPSATFVLGLIMGKDYSNSIGDDDYDA